MLKQPLPPPSPQPGSPGSGPPPPTTPTPPPPAAAVAAASRKANPPPASPNGSLSPGAAGAARAAGVAPPGSGGGGPPGGSGTRSQSTGKGPPQSPVFEGVYNNSRMLHFLTAVVGSTCDVKVKNGSTYEGIFKTLSSKFELAVDAVHKKVPDQSLGPRREDIVDTMVFKPGDVMLVHFRNVDFNYATKDKFTDSAIAMNSKVNGEHKEKVLQRWEGGDSNSDDYDLESDMSNGWDPNEMFKFNEENYGVKTTYDSSLSSYTVPLEKDNSEEFRQREARAAQLAREIESSPQYRLRIAMENDDGRTEEEKHSSVQRQVSGRDSPSLASREGKYVPLPQRVREGSRGGVRCSGSRGGRPGMGSLPPRGSPHHPDSNTGSIPEQRGINGGPSRMSPKSQRPLRVTKSMSSPSSRPMEVSAASSTVGRLYAPRSPKSASAVPVSSQDPPVGSSVPAAPVSPSESRPTTESSASPTPPSPKVPGSAPVAVVEVKDVPSSATKEPSRTLEVMAPSDLVNKANKGLQNEQKRNQLEELRKFGAQFKLQPSSSPEATLDPFRPKEVLEGKVKDKPPETLVGTGGTCEVPDESLKPNPEVSEGSSKEEKGPCEGMERQTQTASPLDKGDADDKEDGPVSEQVKKSTLNPNAKEFNPSKTLLSVNKSTSTPTSPGPRTHSTPSIPVITPGQSGMYSPQYISYIPQIHMSPAVQAPQMYPYPVSNSVPGQPGKYRAKGSLPPQRSDQHQPTSAPPIMQAAAAAGPPLVAATPYSSYISYNPQQFTGQPTMMQPMAHYPSQVSMPVFAPMLQSNPRMMTSGSHPQAIVSSSTPQYPPAEQPTPQTLYAPGWTTTSFGQCPAAAEPIPHSHTDSYAAFHNARAQCSVSAEQLSPAGCLRHPCPSAATARLHQHGPCYPGPRADWNCSCPTTSPRSSTGHAAAPPTDPWWTSPRRCAPEWCTHPFSLHAFPLHLYRAPPSSVSSLPTTSIPPPWELISTLLPVT
ncbi:ataxin-2-like protein isoform X3 [Tiliqua scincoides]|uniref:ataxin-2-like protein isoform X3 n=1 Tax=Tiliqua scincoides TaxID=71010 RepID=UPI00346244C5